eukprot:329915-Alexandrium_andersonii.AAC.1
MLDGGFCFCKPCGTIYMTPGEVDVGVFPDCPQDGMCPNCQVCLTPHVVPPLVREAIRRERRGGPRTPQTDDDEPALLPEQIRVW